MQTSPAQPRKGVVIRIAAAVLIAAAATASAVLLLWGPIGIKTDVIGYPIFANFNGYNYFRLYYLGVVFFPLVSLLLFLAFTRLGHRAEGQPRRPPASLRPPPAPAVASGLETGSAGSPGASRNRRVVGFSRVAFIGAILGLEAGIAADEIWLLPLGIAAYGLLVTVAATALGSHGRWGAPFWERLATVNAVGAPLTVAGLIAVSSSTAITIISTESEKHYTWFPAWLGIPAAALLVAAVAVALGRAGFSLDVRAIERRAVVLIAAPVSIIALLAALPGQITLIDTFDAGQSLAATRLVEDGWLPWRDVVLTHGLLTDVGNAALGFAIFGTSFWGSFASFTVLVVPLYIISLFFLLAYLFWRNWAYLLFCGLVVVGTTFAPVDVRFILWPPILLLLAALIERPTRARSTLLAMLLVVQTVVTPESAPALVAVTAVVIGYEWYWRRPGTGIASAFPRTVWFAASGLCFAAIFCIYMAARGALDDYLYLTINLARGHTVDGAVPPGPNPGTISDAQFIAFALGPPLALVIAFAYAVVRLRLRRPFLTADWVMGATALFVLIYFPKFLSRMDTGHVSETFTLALPLLLYILFRVVAWAEALVRDRWPASPFFRVTARPLSVSLVVVLGVLAWGTLHSRVTDAPARFRPVAAKPPTLASLGYEQGFDAQAFRDLKRITDAYLGPKDRLFDFTNEPALFHFMIDRSPSTRYFLTAGLADTAELQSDLVDRLRQARPKLIAYDAYLASTAGLSSFDGVPTPVRSYLVSRWILDHYRPLLTSHGHSFYLRRDLPVKPPRALHLAEKPTTRGVPFLSQPCTWGYAPNFLSGPGEPPADAPAIAARVGRVEHRRAILAGWAGDQSAQMPATKVIATLNGRVIGRTTPRFQRPDLPAGGYPQGFLDSGFRLSIPAAALQTPDKLHIYAVGPDGAVGELPTGTSAPGRGTVRLLGRTTRLQPQVVVGHIDVALRGPAIQIGLPPGSGWSDYRWLEIDAGKKGFDTGTFALFDHQERMSPSREISFLTLPRSPHRYVIPVSSCAQWHGYRSRRLFLVSAPHQDIAGVRLIR
jgi:hypothetical protein